MDSEIATPSELRQRIKTVDAAIAANEMHLDDEADATRQLENHLEEAGLLEAYHAPDEASGDDLFALLDALQNYALTQGYRL